MSRPRFSLSTFPSASLSLLLTLSVAGCAAPTPAPGLGDWLTPEMSLRAGCAQETARSILLFEEAFAEGARSYEVLCQKVGPPDKVTGSGISIYSYELEDGSTVSLGYAGPHNIVFARWEKADGEVVNLLPDI